MLGNSAWGQVFDTDNVTRVEAVKVASQLKVGMREEDASLLLATNELRNAFGVGAISGWDSCYGLSDGSSLHLSYTAREIAKDGRWEETVFCRKHSYKVTESISSWLH